MITLVELSGLPFTRIPYAQFAVKAKPLPQDHLILVRVYCQLSIRNCQDKGYLSKSATNEERFRAKTIPLMALVLPQRNPARRSYKHDTKLGQGNNKYCSTHNRPFELVGFCLLFDCSRAQFSVMATARPVVRASSLFEY